MAGQARIFAVTWLSYAGFYLCRRNFSIAIPFLKQDGFDAAQLATAISIYSAGYSAGQFVNGVLADRYGSRVVVTVGMLVSALATAFMAVVPSIEMLWLLQGVNGFAQACGWPGLLKLVSEWFPRESRGITMSWWGTNYVLGAFIAGVFATWSATGPLLAALGWQRTLWFPAAALTVMAVLFALSAREGPFAAPLVKSAVTGLAEVIRNPAIWTIAGMYWCVKFARYVFLFWLPLYMTERLGYSAADAGYTSTIFDLAGAVGVVGAGWVSDRWLASRRFPVGATMMFLLGAACLCHPMLAALGWAGNALGIALIGAFTYGPDILMAGAGVPDVVRREVTATAGGFVNSVGSTGQLVSPLAVAWISARWGWDAVFYTVVVVAVAGGAILTAMWSSEGVKEKAHAAG